MKIKLLISRAGVGFSQNAGEEITVKAAEGQRMIDAGQAELVRSGKEPEKAVRKSSQKKRATVRR
ncbi:hypothetical protein [Lentilitoribacter sp. EG35]|uniref:hypothetical protein n=1 Tax=Lentilitoribacter sp. EG35 TaxID=3234192 RepID=UPI003460EBB9